MKARERSLHAGLYEAPITRELRRALQAAEGAGLVVDLRELSDGDSAHILARLLHDRFLHALASLTDKDRSVATEKRVALANDVLTLLRERAPKSGASEDGQLDNPFEELRAVVDPGSHGLAEARSPERPTVPLSMSELLVNSRHDLSVGPEIRRELASADRVDLLCAFLKWSGYRVIEDALLEFLERRPQGLRVLTTAYMGATERRAVDQLARLGADVRISFDTKRTRLHAKAWLFHRESGYSTAMIGSSNLSASAMLDGLEWNVRVAAVDNAAILKKYEATFDHYWNDADFQPYDTENEDHAKRFDEAVRDQKRAHNRLLAAIRVYPRPHQEEILDELAAERASGHHRNLVVAATGTGKTVTAAFDYKGLRKEAAGELTLLYVAHRREILSQSLTAFQLVLEDPAFGELLVGGEMPVRGKHVFASIQSLTEARLGELDPSAYDVVIVDEFHHAAAPSYERLLRHVNPKVLVGLTATPERSDGKSVLTWFDGRIASEMRLWKALDQDLLVPFQYFGTSDGTDLRKVKWTPKGYDTTELRNLYTGGHRWAALVLREVERRVADITRMRALAFCVDVAHAEFMADCFNKAGVESVAVSASTKHDEREDALRRLGDGRLRVVFAVDLFNEGVDVPHIDTVLFLRPTESATVFLQQLGRGLRHADGKECLTVLDFIGHANKRFRYDTRFRAILGGTRRQMQSHVERGFPLLPSGCSITLDRQAQNAVLENIQASLGLGYRALAGDLATLGPATTLAEFLERADVDLDDIYDRPGRCWTALRRQAGFSVGAGGELRSKFENALSRLLHVDDLPRLQGLASLIEAPPLASDSNWLQRDLFVLLGLAQSPLASMQKAWDELRQDEDIRSEVRQLLALLTDRLRHTSHPLEGRLSLLPLRVHATYTLDEVMTALDERDRRGAIRRLREGVFHSARHRADLFFVTLEKSEEDYSPTTLYNDYPVSPTRFHWESQSNTHAETEVGRRYVNHERDGNEVVLFIRQRRKDERGITLPYVCLGTCRYVEHQGERPMQVIWELASPMPSWLYQEVKVAAG